MTRSSNQEPLIFDPEIEATARKRNASAKKRRQALRQTLIQTQSSPQSFIMAQPNRTLRQSTQLRLAKWQRGLRCLLRLLLTLTSNPMSWVWSQTINSTGLKRKKLWIISKSLFRHALCRRLMAWVMRISTCTCSDSPWVVKLNDGTTLSPTLLLLGNNYQTLSLSSTFQGIRHMIIGQNFWYFPKI